MTDQQQLFVAAYFKHHCNASKAAEEAGYADPGQRGWDVKNHPEVKAEIARRLELYAMDGNEVLFHLTTIGRADLGEFLDINSWGTRLDMDKARGRTNLLKRWSGRSAVKGEEIEMWDKLAALNTLARAHGLLDRKSQAPAVPLGEDGEGPINFYLPDNGRH